MHVAAVRSLDMTLLLQPLGTVCDFYVIDLCCHDKVRHGDAADGMGGHVDCNVSKVCQVQIWMMPLRLCNISDLIEEINSRHEIFRDKAS